MRLPSSVMIALAVAVLAALWVGSGLIGGRKDVSQADTASAQHKENEIVEVQVQDLEAQPMEGHITLTGRTRASRTVEVRAETDGQIRKLLVEKGAVVQSGDVLANLEIRDRAARVEEARQLVNQRQIQYDAALELEGKGFNSRVRLAEARAQLESARAQLKDARVLLDKTTIKAPFEGIVDGQFVETGDFLSIGDPVVSLVDLDPLEITGFLTEKQVVDVQVGSVAEAELLTGQVVQGDITYISPAADPETRTFDVEISLPNPEYAIRDGLTAKIRIPLPPKPAYKISPSILTLDDDGTVGIKLVDGDGFVRFVPVVLLEDTPTHLWVGGLPDRIRIITVGQEFVIDGQKVKPVAQEPTPAPEEDMPESDMESLSSKLSPLTHSAKAFPSEKPGLVTLSPREGEGASGIKPESDPAP